MTGPHQQALPVRGGDGLPPRGAAEHDPAGQRRVAAYDQGSEVAPCRPARPVAAVEPSTAKPLVEPPEHDRQRTGAKRQHRQDGVEGGRPRDPGAICRRPGAGGVAEIAQQPHGDGAGLREPAPRRLVAGQDCAGDAGQPHQQHDSRGQAKELRQRGGSSWRWPPAAGRCHRRPSRPGAWVDSTCSAAGGSLVPSIAWSVSTIQRSGLSGLGPRRWWTT